MSMESVLYISIKSLDNLRVTVTVESERLVVEYTVDSFRLSPHIFFHLICVSLVDSSPEMTSDDDEGNPKEESSSDHKRIIESLVSERFAIEPWKSIDVILAVPGLVEQGQRSSKEIGRATQKICIQAKQASQTM